MSSPEEPTFNPSELPSEAVIRVQNKTDMELLEQGYTPDEIVEFRTKAKRISEFWKKGGGSVEDYREFDRENQDE
jgi:hypothetical protein